MTGNILAIDQGTTSTRAVVFDKTMKIVGSSQKEFKQYFPQSGWVEHDAEEIWESVVFTMKDALKRASINCDDIDAIGMTNQRETVVIWDRATGDPIHKAIVWQDRRTAKICDELKAKGLEKVFNQKTGLLLDPYFSGTKIAWLLDHVAGAHKQAAKGQLCFGTIDSWLIWKLTNGKVHATDATNASRTLLYDITKNCWDDELLKILNIPKAMLPEVRDSADDYGKLDASILGCPLSIAGVAGDQHAAVMGNACFEPGMMKSTYGTGCFALLNTGKDKVFSKNRILTTIAYRLNGETTYALEGSIFIAGAAVQWLRDGLKIISKASDSDLYANQADPTQRVYLVPAFTGLGAPHWRSDVRGAIFGLTRNTGPNDFCKAALESVAFQTFDLLQAMKKDWSGVHGDTVLRVDGGMVKSDWTMQRLADILAAPVDRPVIEEATALGAAWLAGSWVGSWPDKVHYAKSWRSNRRFVPKMDQSSRDALVAGWQDAVRRTLA